MGRVGRVLACRVGPLSLIACRVLWSVLPRPWPFRRNFSKSCVCACPISQISSGAGSSWCKPWPRAYTGLCPFHKEKTPSFTVSPTTRGSTTAFGCGAHGDSHRSSSRQSEGLSVSRGGRAAWPGEAGLAVPKPQHAEQDQAKAERRRRASSSLRMDCGLGCVSGRTAGKAMRRAARRATTSQGRGVDARPPIARPSGLAIRTGPAGRFQVEAMKAKGFKVEDMVAGRIGQGARGRWRAGRARPDAISSSNRLDLPGHRPPRPGDRLWRPGDGRIARPSTSTRRSHFAVPQGPRCSITWPAPGKAAHDSGELIVVRRLYGRDRLGGRRLSRRPSRRSAPRSPKTRSARALAPYARSRWCASMATKPGAAPPFGHGRAGACAILQAPVTVPCVSRWLPERRGSRTAFLQQPGRTRRLRAAAARTSLGLGPTSHVVDARPRVATSRHPGAAGPALRQALLRQTSCARSKTASCARTAHETELDAALRRGLRLPKRHRFGGQYPGSRIDRADRQGTSIR